MKPEPKPTGMVCSVCDQPWQPHLQKKTKDGKRHVNVANPTLEDCVRVLKAELASRPRNYANQLGLTWTANSHLLASPSYRSMS